MLTVVDSYPLIITLLLYAVVELDPPLADVRGGTVVEVRGEVVNPPRIRRSHSGADPGLPRLHTRTLLQSTKGREALVGVASRGSKAAA